MATVAFLLLLDTSLLSQGGTMHYSQQLTLQHSTKLQTMQIEHPIWSIYVQKTTLRHLLSTRHLPNYYVRDIKGVEVVVDDILVWGASEEEHDTRLKKVLQCAQSRNLKLNKNKNQIKGRKSAILATPSVSKESNLTQRKFKPSET